jgi:hypothetical protein
VSFKVEPHSFRQVKRLQWPICANCGLVKLKNDFSDFCVKYGCNHSDHPGYKSAMRVPSASKGDSK